MVASPREELEWSAAEVRWRSRRGLLELDLILMPYGNACYHDLSFSSKKIYQWLLKQSDMDLQKWLLWRQDLDSLSEEQRACLQHIWKHHRKKPK